MTRLIGVMAGLAYPWVMEAFLVRVSWAASQEIRPAELYIVLATGEAAATERLRSMVGKRPQLSIGWRSKNGSSDHFAGVRGDVFRLDPVGFAEQPTPVDEPPAL